MSALAPPGAVLLEFARAAVEAYPHECGGAWVYDLRCHEHQWRPLANHASSPEDSFAPSPSEWLELLLMQRAGDIVLHGLGHSHPDAAPHLSSKDRSSYFWEERPAYPQLCWLVAAVWAGKPTVDVRVYRWDAQRSCVLGEGQTVQLG